MELACQSLPLLEYRLALGLLIQTSIFERASDLLGEGHRQLSMPLCVVPRLRMDDSECSDNRASCDNRQPQHSSSMANRFRRKRLPAPARCQHQGCLVGSVLDDYGSGTRYGIVDESGCLRRNSEADDIFARQRSAVLVQPVLLGVSTQVDRSSTIVDDRLELVQDDAEQRLQLQGGADRL